MISVSDLIEKQPCWSIVVRNEEIRVTIVINITERSAATDFQQRKLRLIDDLNKASLPSVVKQLIRLPQRLQLHCSIRDEQVEPPIVVVIKEERAETRKATTWHTEPGFACAIFEKRLAEVQIKRVRLVHQVSDKDVVSAVAVKVSRIDSHSRLSLSVSIDRAAGEQRIVHKPSILLINPELVLISIVRDIDVDPTIVVEISGDNAQSMPKLLLDSRRRGYIFESPVALVMKQTVAGRAKNTRRAIVFRGGGGVAGRIVINRKVGV